MDIIKPQEGYQLKALASGADIVIGGGAAGAGKTFQLLLEPLKHIMQVKDFGGVIFRRTTPQIRNQGGLWDTSMGVYGKLLAAQAKESTLEWEFCGKNKAGELFVNRIKFAHLEHEKNKFDWQGSQIPLIGFDELTHFTESQFFYLLSRNRSMCGVKPYIRATCNPDPDSWVAALIGWWIDADTGFPIPERDGVVRYFYKHGADYVWGGSVDEVYGKAKGMIDVVLGKSAFVKVEHLVKSITFVSGSVYDNPQLLSVDPSYLANLMAQDEQTRAQLLEGNWKYVLTDDDIYEYGAFLGVFNNFYSRASAFRCITADIALKGSDKFVVCVWYGRELTDIVVMRKSNGKEVIDAIRGMAVKHQVPNNRIVYDSDGVGGFVDGFIVGAVPFNGNAAPVPVVDPVSKKTIRENYDNLKTQLVYKSGLEVLRGNYRISEDVASRMFDDKMTVKQRALFERKAFKRANMDGDGKLRIIAKEEMKIKLGGESPDLLDAFYMRELFEVVGVLGGVRVYS